MHVRLSSARGMPVVDDGTLETVAVISDACIDADTGRIAGFWVDAFGAVQPYFLPVQDISAWGTAVHVRDADVMGPATDFLRYRKQFDDPRTFLGQPIRYLRSRRTVGQCTDVQFNTRHFAIEWLFPKTFIFFSRAPVPVTEIHEVTSDAILIQDPVRPAAVPTEKEGEQPLEMPDMIPTPQ